MSGSDLNKIKTNAINKFKKVINEKLLAIILTGSASQNTYKPGWSDLDLLIIVDDLNFDTKCKIAKAVTELEKNSNIHHGVNVITKNDFLNPLLPEIFLDGKTLQTLINLKKYPNRLIYSKKLINLQDVYSPNSEILKKYSLNNISMFLRRNRRTLTSTQCTTKNLKELLKKEIRASLIITKLAVQHFTGTPQESYQKTLDQAKLLFLDFNFSIIENNFRIIEQWQKLNNKTKLLKIFKDVDNYIEKFTYYVFKKSQKQ